MEGVDSNTAKGGSGKRNQNLCYSATYWKTEERLFFFFFYQPTELELKENGALPTELELKENGLLPKENNGAWNVCHFKCAGTGRVHQASWKTLVMYHKNKMTIL